MSQQVAFLSHQTADKYIAAPVGQYLANSGIEPILDIWTFRASAPLHGEIEKHLTRSTCFILFWSDAAAHSDYVQFEDELAVARRTKDDSYSTHIVRLDETPLPTRHAFLIHHDWRRGKPGSKLFATNMERLARAIRGFPLIDAPTVVRTSLSKLELGERKIALEDELEGRFKKAFSLADDIIATKPLPAQGENASCLTDKYTDTNIACFNEMIADALNVLDRLIDVEDDARLRLAHNERGINMAALVLDYEREARYLEAVCSCVDPTIDSNLVLGITYANCGYGKRAVAAMRDALRMLSSLDKDLDEESLARFVYRVTRHVGCVFSNAQELLSLVTFKTKDAMRARLENTLECLDEAIERERLLDFRDAKSHVFYGDLFDVIGLTRHALRHYDKAIERGISEAEIDLRKVERIRGQLDQLESSLNGGEPNVTVEITTTQMPNFNLQLGNLPADMECIIRDHSSDFYRDFVEDDAVFTQTLSP